jgi:LysR family transcriptional regulator, regulator for bpeEF and oprC
MDQLEAIRTFARVAELGSFSHAAEELDLSRAATSQQVQALEAHLGVKLLSRTTRRVALTQDGAEYLERCRLVLRELDAADESMRRLRERVQGRLRVDVPTLFGRHLLVPALPAFTERYPELTLEVQYNDRIVDLAAERVDLTVRFARVSGPGLIARRIGTTQLITCASPDYLARAGVPVTIEELRRHRLIGQLSPGSGRPLPWLFRLGTQTRRLELPSQLLFNSIEGRVQAAISGLGILQAGHLIVNESLRQGKLQAILSATIADGPPVSVVYLQSSKGAAKVRVFADFLAEVFRRYGQTHAAGRATAQ